MKRKINNYSISKVLREQNKSNDVFEIQLANLSLEELIALKLELGFKAIGFPLYGFPVWRSVPLIAKDAVLKYVLASSNSKEQAMRILGLDPVRFFKLLKKYKIRDYFKEEKNNVDWRKTKDYIS